MILPPGVRYSIIRNNVEVPLVPMDQLPFQIQGLPRELTLLRSHEEGWRSIGETQQPALPLSIRVPADLQPSQPVMHTNRRFLPPDHHARKGLIPNAEVSRPLRQIYPAAVAFTEKTVHHLASTSPAACPASTITEGVAATRLEGIQYPPYRLPNPSGIEPDPPKKEYCTHWIRTNSCDYMQQGCRFKHEVPDRKKLEELGFPQIPKWYRDKTAIPAGASSWLRPRTAQDDNNRQLSVEPSASRAFRPSILGISRNQSRAAELLGSTALKADHVPVEMPNLIDLDDPSIVTLSLNPSLSVSPLSGAASFNAKAVVSQPPERVTGTLASSLRQEGLEVKRHMESPVVVDTLTTARASDQEKSNDAPLIASVHLANDVYDSPSRMLPHTILSDLSNGKDVSETNNSVSRATKRGQAIAKSFAASEGERYIRSSKPQKKRGPHPRKLTERAAASATRDGLSIPQHATGKKPREGHTPGKGLKRGNVHDEGKDLQFEIVQRQRAVHEKEKFSKGATSNDVQSLVATAKTEAL